MALKAQNTFSNTVGNTNHTAKVYWCSEWQEYQVRLFINGVLIRAATYFTDEREDAVSTAGVMCKLPKEN